MMVANGVLSAVQNAESKEAVDKMGQSLDANQDGKVGFEEYMKLVGYLAVSLSEQRNLADQEPAANAASGQVAQCAPAKVEEKSEAEAKPSEEATAAADAKVEVPAVPTVDLKVDGKAEPMVDLKLDANASPKVEVNLEGATEPIAVGEEMPAAAVAAAVEAAGEEVTAKEVVTEVVKVVTTEEEVEEAKEEVALDAEEVEKKTEEASS